MVMAASSVEALLPLASKKTSSEEVGTEALLAPPEVADQLVLPVASQLASAPPPTQYLEALWTKRPSMM